MTKVLTPLTTPPMNPPEETIPAPIALAISRALAESSCHWISSCSFISCSSSRGHRSCRFSARAVSWCSSRWKAAGISRMMDMTASAMPGPITRPARASTPITATRVSTRARGRRSFAPFRFLGNRCRSMARMGTFRIKARAPPSRNGAKMPSSQPSAARTASRRCSAQ